MLIKCIKSMNNKIKKDYYNKNNNLLNYVNNFNNSI